jgi:16S rRNA (cytosine967-C5)-methyltransferase
MINARRAAYNALTAVTKDGAYTNLAIKENIPSDMPGESKKFASALFKTTLENLIIIDFALDHFIKSGRVHGSVRNVLRLGACQLMFFDTKDYAAVNESTELIKQIKPQMSGFVNGVLRSLAAGIGEVKYPSGDTAEALSINNSYPLWICEKYIHDFGYGFTKELLSYQTPHETSIRMNPLRTDKKSFETALKEAGIEFREGKYKDAYILNNISDIENFDLFIKGWFAVQSESSMYAVLQIGVKPGMKLLDCCAAPGGKSAYAAALADNGLDIEAWDIHEHRVEMMRKNFERLGVKNTKVDIHDATEFMSEYKEAFDVVIVDAPCSAMGLMAKNADIRYARKSEDIKALSEKQYEILSVCSGYVKPGGILAYFTCSINKEENEQVAGRFITSNKDFKCIKEETLYPHLCGSDGFYIAVMRRNI